MKLEVWTLTLGPVFSYDFETRSSLGPGQMGNNGEMKDHAYKEHRYVYQASA